MNFLAKQAFVISHLYKNHHQNTILPCPSWWRSHLNQEMEVNAIRLVCRSRLAAPCVCIPPFHQAADGPKTLKNKERILTLLPMSKFYITTQTTKHLFNLWLSPCKKTKYILPHFSKRVFIIFFCCASYPDFVCNHQASDLTETGKH